MQLNQFLDRKPLFYDTIDLSRMPRAYATVLPHLKKGRILHLVGTNGKGSTGRMLAELLRGAGLRVGHYSSPHILKFNERIWIDGEDVSDEALEEAHERLMRWLPTEMAEALSYFEYTTLLALVAFEGLDAVVFEAGLGGEFDATSVVERELTIVTPIGFDHQAFLGDTIEAIATTKLRAIAKRAVVAPQPYRETVAVARRIAAEKGSSLLFVEESLTPFQKERIEAIGRAKGWPPFLRRNGMTAFAAARMFLGEDPDLAPLQRVRLRGRFERIAPNIVVDVGHNPLAARAVAETLDDRMPVLVYNALADKDIDEVLAILAPVVSRLELIAIENDRAVDAERIADAAARYGLEIREFREAKADEAYLVFGSFAVAEAFFKKSRHA
ncbi:bifunctional folylpolyglutamate synthase/dihydrofolate synthase [Hydrogenimonas sp.]